MQNLVCLVLLASNLVVTINTTFVHFLYIISYPTLPTRLKPARPQTRMAVTKLRLIRCPYLGILFITHAPWESTPLLQGEVQTKEEAQAKFLAFCQFRAHKVRIDCC